LPLESALTATVIRMCCRDPAPPISISASDSSNAVCAATCRSGKSSGRCSTTAVLPAERDARAAIHDLGGASSWRAAQAHHCQTCSCPRRALRKGLCRSATVNHAIDNTKQLDLNMPLTSRNVLVELVARGGIEPPTFRFSVTHFTAGQTADLTKRTTASAMLHLCQRGGGRGGCSAHRRCSVRGGTGRRPLGWHWPAACQSPPPPGGRCTASNQSRAAGRVISTTATIRTRVANSPGDRKPA
jgi:hypothetical protein